jgi:hypothetical protein
MPEPMQGYFSWNCQSLGDLLKNNGKLGYVISADTTTMTGPEVVQMIADANCGYCVVIDIPMPPYLALQVLANYNGWPDMPKYEMDAEIWEALRVFEGNEKVVVECNSRECKKICVTSLSMVG